MSDTSATHKPGFGERLWTFLKSPAIKPMTLALAITVPISILMVLTGIRNQRTDLAYIALAPLATWALVILIVWLQLQVDTVGATAFGRALQVAVAIATPLWLYVAILAWWGSEVFPILTSLQTALGYLSMVIGIMWVIAGTFGAWRRASHTRNQLAHSVRMQEQFNELLTQAEKERFTEYRTVIASKVVGSLDRVMQSWNDSTNEVLASQLENLTDKVMRPLAHQLHPVTLRVGLIPSIRSLGSGYRLDFDSNVTDLDESGQLLDPAVTPQVFRWVRNLNPEGTSVTITIRCHGDDVIFSAVGVANGRDLDPIQRVAGLRSEQVAPGRCRLIAPRAGTTPPEMILENAHPQKQSPVSGGGWGVLTSPPVVSVPLVLYIGVVSAPITSVVRREEVGVEALWITILGVIIPALIAWPLSRINVNTGTRQGALVVLALWLGLAIFSATVINAVIAFFAPVYSTVIGNILRFVGSFSRYAIAGPSFTVTRGFISQTKQDEIGLQARKAEINRNRADLLGLADDTDRFLAETLHRTVQGRIAAIALLLRLDRRSEAEREMELLTQHTLPELEAKLAEWMQTESVNEPDSSFTVPGLEIIDNSDWQTLIPQDPALAERLRSVVHESAVNARRHGHSSVMIVNLAQSGPQLVLTCSDNGSGPDPDSIPGLGSALLDEVSSIYAGSWSLKRENGNTIMRMEMPAGTGGISH